MRLLDPITYRSYFELGIHKYKFDSDPDKLELLNKLYELQSNHDELYREYNSKLLELANEYAPKFNSVYMERYNTIKNNPELKSFWLQAMKNYRTIQASIEPWDEPVLANLCDIRAEYLNPKDQKSFRLDFVFSDDNTFFLNKVLSKEFLMELDQTTGNWLLVKTIGTEIIWKDGFDVVNVYETKKQRNKTTKQLATVKMRKSRPSFFNFFQSRQFANSSEFSFFSEDEIQKLENYFSVDLELAQIFKDRLIPKALGWFLYIEFDSEEEFDDAD